MAITNGYTTLNIIRAAVGITDAADTSEDSKLEAAVNAASRQIDGYCGQRFWLDGSVVDRQLFADSGRVAYVDGDYGGIATTAGLVVKIDADGDGTFETTLTQGTDFQIQPLNAADLTPVQPFTSLWLSDNYSFPMLANGRAGVQVTARWGWPAVPDDVAQACLIQAEQLYKAKDAAFGVAGFGEFGAIRIRSALHPIAEGLLAPYRRPALG